MVALPISQGFDECSVPLLVMKNVHVRHSTQARSVSVHGSIWPGQLIEVVGAAAVGKTTLLKLIQGQLKPSEGVIERPHQAMEVADPYRSACAAVFASSQLWSQMSLRDNWMRVARVAAKNQAVDGQVDYLLRVMGLLRYANQLPDQLSQGIVKMALIGMALLARPALLLIDDLGDGLDCRQQQWLFGMMSDLSVLGMAVCYSVRAATSRSQVDRWVIGANSEVAVNDRMALCGV